jgi:hypothetical protein
VLGFKFKFNFLCISSVVNPKLFITDPAPAPTFQGVPDPEKGPYSKMELSIVIISVADPGSGACLPQGSGIRDEFFPDPGSRIPDPKHD